MKEAKEFWNSRRGSLIICATVVVLAYALGIRAIDTGSLQQYFALLILLILFANRLIYSVRGK